MRNDVIVIHEARRGLKYAQASTLDVGVLDIGLPDKNGNKLASRLRSRPGTARTTLIALTGYGQEQDRQAALAAVFHYHLVKPVGTRRQIA
jgi:CheY-like chemotaxis protein